MEKYPHGQLAGDLLYRLSGSVRGWVTTWIMGEILWHRRETRRQTEKTNFALTSGEFSAYSKTLAALPLTQIIGLKSHHFALWRAL